MTDELEGFARTSARTVRGIAMTGAAGAGASAGLSVGNTIIAAGFGAACSPFALVLPLAVGGAYGVYKLFKACGLED